jgi:two-component system, chemotaxis family, protein-glutamate methylesterase/glutaminase
MRTKYIVVIGASAGGLETLRELVAALPADFAAPICLVLHTSPQAPGVLDSILSRAGKLPASNARDRERLKAGHIYIAPPDFHLLVEPGVVRITKGPRENRFRPAIDPLFRSAAQVYGPAAIGVVLTGNLDDGTAGLWVLKQLGGTAIVQAPDDALFPGMPQSAIEHVKVDYVVPVVALAPLLVRLTGSVPAESPAAAPLGDTLEVEVKIAKEQNPLAAGLRQIGEPSSFACPECHGVLLRLKEGGPVRFRCHTGHAYSLETLLAGMNEGIEETLWSAIRALEEGEMLLRTIGDHLESHNPAQAAHLRERAAEARRQSDELRTMTVARQPLALKS